MQWETIMKLQSTSLVTVPSFLLNLIDYALANGIDLKKNPVEKAICIGEGIRDGKFDLNPLGEQISAQWPIKLYNTYASTEMQTAFTECSHGKGGHLQPDLVILEVLDDHGKAVSEGEYGEVTITTLGIEGMPLIRYRTGDICAWYQSKCECGRWSKRLSPVLGRKQQMIKLKGTTLYPSAIFDLLQETAFVKEYVVEVFSNALGTDEVRVHLHTEEQDCEEELSGLFRGRLRVNPQFRQHSLKDIQEMQFPNGSRKKVRFLDKRPGLD